MGLEKDRQGEGVRNSGTDEPTHLYTGRSKLIRIVSHDTRVLLSMYASFVLFE